MIPLIMIIGGWMMWKHCPKELNSVVGYRTSRSMRTMDTWKFAHEYCGKLWWKIGWISMTLTIVVPIFFLHRADNIVGMVGGVIMIFQTAAILLSIVPVERELEKTFTKEGKYRTEDMKKKD